MLKLTLFYLAIRSKSLYFLYNLITFFVLTLFKLNRKGFLDLQFLSTGLINAP